MKMPRPLLEASAPDLTICDREPITRLEQIQPFGFLLAMSSDWTVKRASENLESVLGMTASKALGSKLDALLDPTALHEIRNRMLSLYLTRGTERLFGITLVKDRAPLDLSVHQSGDLFVLEGEPSVDPSATDAALLVRRAMARLVTRTTFEAFHTDAARQIRGISGFDRVMVYRFDDNGDGEVIAEALSADMESYLGLHYPASDIPAQARELYLRNPFRIIADVRRANVPILGVDPATPLDLTLSVTRAVSPIHIEYLKNMNVAASMSISIVVERKLWGLIACHHKTARLPSFVTRTSAELLGQMYSLSLESRLREHAEKQQTRLTDARGQILTAVVGEDALLSRAEWLQDILRDVIGADGAAVVFRDSTSIAGDVPDLDVIESIVEKLKSSPAGEIFATDHLASLISAAERCADRAAGMLAIPISGTPRDYILLFRREVLREVRWAGNPSKAAHSNPSARISPRASFDVFVERVARRSVPFSARDKQAAEIIRAALIEVVLKVSENVDSARQQASGRQEILIAELNHRVRNLLAVMRSLVNQSGAQATSVEEYVASIGGRIQSLARAHDRVTQRNWTPARLSSLLDDEIAAYVPTEKQRFLVVGAPVMLKPKAFATLALVIHELVTNSCKYGALSAKGRVEIDINVVPEAGLYLKWRERDGPLVKTPTRRGFGSVIIERTVPFDLQGTASVDYAQAGFEAMFFIPQHHLALTETSTPLPGNDAGTSAGVKSKRPLNGLSTLLLEDNFVLSLDADDMLKALGASEVHVASSVAGALQLIEKRVIRFALLDINLGLETSDAVALRLKTLGIPFVLASGYGERPPHFANDIAAPLVMKPFDRDLIRSAIAQVIDPQ